MKPNKLLLCVLAATVTLTLSATSMAEAQVFDWQKFAGDTIKVFAKTPMFEEIILEMIPEFEKLTGMKVEYESMDATSYRSTLPIRLTAKTTDFDVMSTMSIVDGLRFLSAGWYEPLDKYILNGELTHPEWDFEDFPFGVQSNVMRVKGQVIEIPWETQTPLLYYRKDLFEEKGLAAVETFTDLEQAAEKLTDKINKFYGIALRGAGYQTTTPFSAFLYGFGGSWTDKEGNPTFDSPEAIEAIAAYGGLGYKYGPPGMASFGWKVPAQLFAQGRVAMFLDVNNLQPNIVNPEKSRVVGKVGYAKVPKGRAGRFPFVAAWGWAINAFSEKKEQAWYFIQWQSSKRVLDRLQLKGYPTSRISTMTSWEFKIKDKHPDFTRVNMESYAIGMRWMNPPYQAALEAREIVGAVVTRAIEGISIEEIRELARQANKELKELK